MSQILRRRRAALQHRRSFVFRDPEDTRPQVPTQRPHGETHVAPRSVHTHERQPTHPFETFAAFLDKEPPLTELGQGTTAYTMCDYCLHSRRMMESVVQVLESNTSDNTTSMARLTQTECALLRKRRTQWIEHMRGSFHTLMLPPPGSGGSTARYSLAMQLWLLVAHANVILLQSDAVDGIYEYDPATVPYLSRNSLVVENGPVMGYPQRTVLMALEHLTTMLDTLDRFHKEYATYICVLEYRISELICHAGTKAEFNAPEWSEPRDPKNKNSAECVSDEFRVYTLTWFLTLYNYADNWISLLRTRSGVPMRVPVHIVARAEWVPSQRSLRRLTAFICEYTFGLKDDRYGQDLREFLLRFDVRPPDMDLYRVLMKSNRAQSRTVLQNEFRGMSAIGRVYLRQVHYDRTVYSYVVHALQWADSPHAHTQSASLARLGQMRQLALVFAIHQYMHTMSVDFRTYFIFFHRATDFLTAYNKTLMQRWPVIVQLFSRFCVIVPHRRPPQLDIAAVLLWRARSRTRRKNLPMPVEPAVEEQAYAPSTGQYTRIYECRNFLESFAVWSLWLLQLTDGKIDRKTNLKAFLTDLFGWN